MRASSTRRRSDDDGFNLVELVITTAVVGIVIGSISAAVMVIVRQEANTRGQIANTVAEQALNQWLTPDLASAEASDTSAGATPCIEACPPGTETGGSNAVALQWRTYTGVNGVMTEAVRRVSYRYVGRASEYELVRVACTKVGSAPETCDSRPVVRDVPPPPGAFVAGVTEPSWLLRVSEPSDVGNGANRKNGRVVFFTVDGGGSMPGAGGGVETIVVGGSGTERRQIPPGASINDPALGRTLSRCGGSFGVVIDVSASIGAEAMGEVRSALTGLVAAFDGTPVKLQMVTFNEQARATVGTTAWSKYFDMTVPDDVTALRDGIAKLKEGGGTNWEDGLFRMFYEADGSRQTTTPSTVLFFTDGVPTWSRFEQSSAARSARPVDRGVDPLYPSREAAHAVEPLPGWAKHYYHAAYLRAAALVASLAADTRFIGVGVGESLDVKVDWTDVVRRGGRNVLEPASPVKTGSDVLTALIAADDNVVVARTDPGTEAYVNADVANLYLVPKFSRFNEALKAVALASCGGTLTVQTKSNGVALAQTMTYQEARVTDPAGQPVPTQLRAAVTDATTTTGTFDYTIGTGTSVIVDVVPVVSTQHANLVPVGWQCRAGATPKAVQTIPGTGAWSGARVSVGANEAVSCTLGVRPA